MKLLRNVMLIGLFIVVSPSPVLQAQATSQKAEVFTLQRAISYALGHYPSVRAALEQIWAAQGGVSLASTNYLPSLNTLWQSNRATDNNIPGLLFQQGVVPPISGPVSATTSNRSVWGSATGVLLGNRLTSDIVAPQ